MQISFEYSIGVMGILAFFFFSGGSLFSPKKKGHPHFQTGAFSPIWTFFPLVRLGEEPVFFL